MVEPLASASVSPLVNHGWVADAQGILDVGQITWQEAEWKEWSRYACALAELGVVALYPMPTDEPRSNRLAANNGHGLWVAVPLRWEAGDRALLESMSELVSAVRQKS